MLFGDKLHLPKFGFGGNVEKLPNVAVWEPCCLERYLRWHFVPQAVFSILAHLFLYRQAPKADFYCLPSLLFATALPVLIIAFLLAFSVENVGKFYGKVTTFQKWLNSIRLLFVAIGAYYLLLIFF